MQTHLPELMGDNRLLAQLRDADRLRLLPHLSSHELAAGHVLQSTGEDVTHTWFPCGAAIASFQVLADDGAAGVEVGIVGREGAIGGIVSNGFVPAYATALVRADGTFLKIRTALLEAAKLDSISFRHLFSRYSDCLIAQLFQNVACNATHTTRQRAAKWLLATAARTGSLELTMTQEQLADLLGVGRTFVARIVKGMREEGLIRTRRGMFELTDTEGLHGAACQCADVLEQHYDVVLHGIYPTEGAVGGR